MADNDLDLIPVRNRADVNVSDIRGTYNSKLDSSSFQREFDLLKNESLRSMSKY